MIYGLLPQLYEARGFNQISLSPEIQQKARENPLKKKIAPLNPVFAKPEFSTDNAMGVAVLAYRMMEG